MYIYSIIMYVDRPSAKFAFINYIFFPCQIGWHEKRIKSDNKVHLMYDKHPFIEHPVTRIFFS